MIPSDLRKVPKHHLWWRGTSRRERGGGGRDGRPCPNPVPPRGLRSLPRGLPLSQSKGWKPSGRGGRAAPAEGNVEPWLTSWPWQDNWCGRYSRFLLEKRWSRAVCLGTLPLSVNTLRESVLCSNVYVTRTQSLGISSCRVQVYLGVWGDRPPFSQPHGRCVFPIRAAWCCPCPPDCLLSLAPSYNCAYIF